MRETEKKKSVIKSNESQLWSMFVDRHILKTTKTRKYAKSLCKKHDINL